MKFYSAALLAIFLASCTSAPTDTDRQARELGAYSVVTVTDPSFQPSRGETISWIADVIFVGDGDAEAPAELEQMIRADINRQLDMKGYARAEGPDVHYRLIALLQTGNKKLSEEMRELFHLYPSLGRDSHTHQGMLIVALARPGTTQTLWRGGIKVFLDDQHLLTDAQRQKRLEIAVAKVMGSLPKAL